MSSEYDPWPVMKTGLGRGAKLYAKFGKYIGFMDEDGKIQWDSEYDVGPSDIQSYEFFGAPDPASRSIMRKKIDNMIKQFAQGKVT